jgi:succinate dehydrogenase hydrophobic anchor subunit
VERREEMITAIILIVIVVFLVIGLISQKLAVEACVAWMVENNYDTPTNEDVNRLVVWCVKKHLEDLSGKS